MKGLFCFLTLITTLCPLFSVQAASSHHIVMIQVSVAPARSVPDSTTVTLTARTSQSVSNIWIFDGSMLDINNVVYVASCDAPPKGVFTRCRGHARHAQGVIYQIDRKQPWQSYIETHFNVQRRMADWYVSKADTWPELVASHDKFVADYNYQVHWAHQDRQDGRHSPAEVLGWVQGTQRAPATLHRIFYSTRFGRTLDTLGYVRFRHWRIYGEHGLARRRAAVWLYGETLLLEFSDEPLAQYGVSYEPNRRYLREVVPRQIFETQYRSPQLPLWEIGDGEWLKVVRTPPLVRQKRRSATVEQLYLAVPGLR